MRGCRRRGIGRMRERQVQQSLCQRQRRVAEGACQACSWRGRGRIPDKAAAACIVISFGRGDLGVVAERMDSCTVATIFGTPPRSNRLCQRCTVRKGRVAGEDPLGTAPHPRRPRVSCSLCLGTCCARARRRRTSCQSGSAAIPGHPERSGPTTREANHSCKPCRS